MPKRYEEILKLMFPDEETTTPGLIEIENETLNAIKNDSKFRQKVLDLIVSYQSEITCLESKIDAYINESSENNEQFNYLKIINEYLDDAYIDKYHYLFLEKTDDLNDLEKELLELDREANTDDDDNSVYLY